MTSLSISRLSPRQSDILDFVSRFRMVSALHIERVFFADGSERSQAIRRRRTLATLTKLGYLSRLGRGVGGYSGGSDSYIYMPGTYKARVPVPHILDVTELAVQLIEADRAGRCQLIEYVPEPFCYEHYGNTEVRPDAKATIRTASGTYVAYIEVDRSTEWKPQLGAKMRRFTSAWRQRSSDFFPHVVFVVPDEDRARVVQSVARRQERPQMFRVVVAADAIDYFCQ